MASTLTSNLQTGGVQFQTALRNSQNAVSSLLRQAGVTMPGGGAAGGIGGAFDPYNVVGGQAFDASSLTGTSYGSEGAYSEAYQAGGNIAAEQAMQSRSRGLGGGGLAAQRQELALMQTQGGAADVTKSLIEGLGTQYGVAQQANVDELQRQADKLTTDANAAAAAGPIAATAAATAPDTSVTPPPATTSNPPNTAGPDISVNEREAYTKKGNPGGKETKNPKPGNSFKGSGGVTWVYRTQPKGPGWYKK